MQTHNSLSQQCLLASCPVSFIAVSSYYTNWINSSCSFSISTNRTVSPRVFFLSLLGWVQTYTSLRLVPSHIKVKETKKKQKNHDICLWTCCICQIYGITLYRAAWADESSSRPTGFQIHLSAQTFCFLPHMCCALKQTRPKVCNVKSVFAQVC